MISAVLAISILFVSSVSAANMQSCLDALTDVQDIMAGNSVCPQAMTDGDLTIQAIEAACSDSCTTARDQALDYVIGNCSDITSLQESISLFETGKKTSDILCLRHGDKFCYTEVLMNVNDLQQVNATIMAGDYTESDLLPYLDRLCTDCMYDIFDRYLEISSILATDDMGFLPDLTMNTLLDYCEANDPRNNILTMSSTTANPQSTSTRIPSNAAPGENQAGLGSFMAILAAGVGNALLF